MVIHGPQLLPNWIGVSTVKNLCPDKIPGAPASGSMGALRD